MASRNALPTYPLQKPVLAHNRGGVDVALDADAYTFEDKAVSVGGLGTYLTLLLVRAQQTDTSPITAILKTYDFLIS